MVGVGIILLLVGLVIGSGLLLVLGVVLIALGLFSGVGGYGWWYPRRRGPY